MFNSIRIILIPFFVFITGAIFSQTRWSFELQFGVVHSLDLPLTFYQAGYPDIKIKKANFYSEPLIDPPYWNWRISKWFKNKSIEFEAIHHKFYLINLPPEIEKFGISHGYNMVMFNHGREVGKFILRAGLGSAIVHGESTIRGMVYPNGPGFDFGGYHLRGLTVNLGAARQIKVSKHFFVNTELKVNSSFANIPIILGHARVNIIVFQFIIGPGFNWSVRKDD